MTAWWRIIDGAQMIHRFNPKPALAFAGGNFTIMTAFAVPMDLLVTGPGHALFSFNSSLGSQVAIGLMALIALVLALPFHLWFSLRANEDLLQAGLHGHRVAFALGLLCPAILGLAMAGMVVFVGTGSWMAYAVLGIALPVICAELSVAYFRAALVRVLVRR